MLNSLGEQHELLLPFRCLYWEHVSHWDTLLGLTGVFIANAHNSRGGTSPSAPLGSPWTAERCQLQGGLSNAVVHF